MLHPVQSYCISIVVRLRITYFYYLTIRKICRAFLSNLYSKWKHNIQNIFETDKKCPTYGQIDQLPY